jgi:hypothetical protein
MEGSGRGLIEILSRYLPRGPVECNKMAVMITNVSVTIRNVHLLNTSPERYRHTNLLDHLIIFRLRSLFWKKGSWIVRSPCCLCVCINFWVPEPICMKLGMYPMAPEPISTACFITPYHEYMCLYVSVSRLSLLGNGSVITFPRQ